MSLIPGIAGQKTELFDGAKIDAISEYTTGNGVQHQGRTNGIIIPAGFIGETKEVSTATGWTGNANVYSTASEVLSITSGVWLLMYSVLVQNEAITRPSIMGIRIYDNTAAAEVPLSHGTHINPITAPSNAYGVVSQFAFYRVTTPRDLILQITCEVAAAQARAQLIKEFSGIPGDDHHGKFAAIRIA